MNLLQPIGRWYRREGLIQFLLGNMWNDFDACATGGRGTLVFCWGMMLVVAVSIYLGVV